MALSDQKSDRLDETLDNLAENAELLEKLMDWLNKSEQVLQDRDSKPTPEDVDRIQSLLKEHQVGTLTGKDDDDDGDESDLKKDCHD